MTIRSLALGLGRVGRVPGLALLGFLAAGCGGSKPSSGDGGFAAGAGAGGSSSGGAAGGVAVSSGMGGLDSSGGTLAAGGDVSGLAGGTSGTSNAGGGSGGNGGSAGTGGSGGMAGSATGSACAGKSYALCEDFESGVVDGIPTGWTALKGFGSAEGIGLANDQKHSGSMSLKSNSQATGQGRVQKSLMALGATATLHFGRIFYKVQSPAQKPSGGVIHLTLTALEGTTENRVVDTVQNSNGAYQFLFNIPDDSCCVGSPYDYRFDDTWHCAEWHVSVADQSFQFWIDGMEVKSLTFTGRAGARMSSFKSVAVGAIFYQKPPTPIVVWFDDLAIDDTRIGCD